MVCIRQVVKEVERARGRRGVRVKDIVEYLETRLAKAVKKGVLKKTGPKFNLAKSCRSVSSSIAHVVVRRASRKETAVKRTSNNEAVNFRASKKELLNRKASRQEFCGRGRPNKGAMIPNIAIQKNKRETTKKRKVRFQQPQEDQLMQTDACVSRIRRCRGRYNLRRGATCPKSFCELAGGRPSKVKNVKSSFCNIPSKLKVQRKRLSNKEICAASSSKQRRHSSPSRQENRASTSRGESPTSPNHERRRSRSRGETSTSPNHERRRSRSRGETSNSPNHERRRSRSRGETSNSPNHERRRSSSRKEPSPRRASNRESDSDDESSNVSESQSRLLSTRDSLEVLKERISRKSLDLGSAVVPQAPCAEPRISCVDLTPSEPAVTADKCPSVIMFNPANQKSCSSRSLFSVFTWPQKR